MMPWLRYLILGSLMMNHFVVSTLALPEHYGELQMFQNLSAENPCVKNQGFESNFCDRCLRRGIKEPKACINTELRQSKPDGLISPPDTIAGVEFSWHGTNFSLEVNIDSCRRVEWDMPIGPLTLASREIPKATVGVIVEHISTLPPRDAIDLVLHNAKRGLQEANAFLAKGQDLYSFPDVGATIRNSSIRAICSVVFRGGIAASTFLAISGAGHGIFGGMSKTDESLITGVVAILVTILMLALIDKLEEVMDMGLGLASYEWTSWIVLSVISRIRAFIQNIPPQRPRFYQDELRRFLVEWVRSQQEFWMPELGIHDLDEARATGLDLC